MAQHSNSQQYFCRWFSHCGCRHNIRHTASKQSKPKKKIQTRTHCFSHEFAFGFGAICVIPRTTVNGCCQWRIIMGERERGGIQYQRIKKIKQNMCNHCTMHMHTYTNSHTYIECVLDCGFISRVYILQCGIHHIHNPRFGIREQIQATIAVYQIDSRNANLFRLKILEVCIRLPILSIYSSLEYIDYLQLYIHSHVDTPDS